MTARPFDIQPTDGPAWKWWAVEVRFDRNLTARQVRHLAAAVEEHGVDRGGAVWAQWRSKYPQAHQDGEGLLRALERVGVPGRWRAAPLGWGCPGATCSYADDDRRHRCQLGDAYAASPVWTDGDWHRFDFAAVSPAAPAPAGQG